MKTVLLSLFISCLLFACGRSHPGYVNYHPYYGKPSVKVDSKTRKDNRKKGRQFRKKGINGEKNMIYGM